MELSFPGYKLQILKRGWIFFILLFLILSFFSVHFFLQQQEMEALKKHEKETLQEIASLKKQIVYHQKALQSVEDPDWIERQMIENLGVIPEGYKAIYFTSDENE